MTSGLLWNTCGKDIEWFEYSIRSYAKFARGFDDAVCFVPRRDEFMFAGVCAKYGVRLVTGEEWPGAGFNWHQFWQCCADLLLDTDIIFHLDADTVFTQPVSPDRWMRGGKLLGIFNRFADLDQSWGPGMWKSRVDEALGGDVKLATMCTPPYVHYRGVYVELRRAVQKQHPEGLEKYLLGRQNEFPQGFCEFETLGAIAQEFFHNDYEWLDLKQHANPSKGFVAEGWSHGGLDKVTDRFDSISTAREVFARLGL
jgi:hypothetical protein